jgi:ketosteroid isomerase-like protein
MRLIFNLQHLPPFDRTQNMKTPFNRLALQVAAALAATLSLQAFASQPTAQSISTALDSAWNSRDVARIERLYAERARVTDVREGDVVAGRATIVQQIAQKWESLPANARHRTVTHNVQSLGNGQYLADATVYIEATNAQGAVDTLGEYSLVARVEPSNDGVEVVAVRSAKALPETVATPQRKFRITRGLGRPIASQG